MTSNHDICNHDDNELAGLSIHEAAQLFAQQVPRKRLIVEPLQWTANHLAFLRCSFVQVTPNASPSGPGPTKKKKPWAPTKETAREQALQWVAGFNRLAWTPDGPLRKLLEAYSFKSVQ
ncbi:hypothetical protein CTA1_2265 [Colletotrichum tanaceti]|uniref:Uncharacterized protein n=1 Tax=Colletotrichum tanaceti TaxID=1306861 RepID=A0A4U6XFD7_9PEZI|nr:hypothetical protein CTA1_2265 [Colletotrichum tanaceti]